MQKEHKLKANDRGTKTENVENLKPTGKHTEIAEKLKNSSKYLNSH